MQSLGFKVLASSHTLTKVPPVSCTSRHSISSVFNITCCVSLPPFPPKELRSFNSTHLSTNSKLSYQAFRCWQVLKSLDMSDRSTRNGGPIAAPLLLLTISCHLVSLPCCAHYQIAAYFVDLPDSSMYLMRRDLMVNQNNHDHGSYSR
jgi:hypothetical protein